jgi:hypothetical protein
MMKSVLGAVILAACCFCAFAADAVTEAPPKGTVCFAYDLRDADAASISCKGLGKFPSISAIYEKGYKVVATSYAVHANQGLYSIVVEQAK